MCLFGENDSFSGVDSLRVFNEEEKLVLKRMKQLFENDKKQQVPSLKDLDKIKAKKRVCYSAGTGA